MANERWQKHFIILEPNGWATKMSLSMWWPETLRRQGTEGIFSPVHGQKFAAIEFARRQSTSASDTHTDERRAVCYELTPRHVEAESQGHGRKKLVEVLERDTPDFPLMAVTTDQRPSPSKSTLNSVSISCIRPNFRSMTWVPSCAVINDEFVFVLDCCIGLHDVPDVVAISCDDNGLRNTAPEFIKKDIHYEVHTFGEVTQKALENDLSTEVKAAKDKALKVAGFIHTNWYLEFSYFK